MHALATDLRNQLERTVIAARDIAEGAARAALVTLAVERTEPFPSMDEDQRRLRRALRAVARQHGGGHKTAGMRALVEEMAYGVKTPQEALDWAAEECQVLLDEFWKG